MAVKLYYITPQTVSITLASLADEAFAVSAVIDNSTDKCLSADIQYQFKTGTVSVGTDMPTVAVFLLRSADGGTTYDDADDNARLLDVFEITQDNHEYIFSVDTSQTVSQLPDYFKLALKNKTGDAFDSISANFHVEYHGKKFFDG